MKNAAAVFLCGIVMFVWGSASWMILPWHQNVANQFADESEVAEVIRKNAPRAGIYWLPFADENYKAGETAAFVNALPDGYDMDMGKLMVAQLAANWAGALIFLLLLSATAGLCYWGRVGFVTLVGAAVGFIGHFPYWNWFGFPTEHFAVTFLDGLAASFLAGLVMAKLVKGRESART